MKQTNLGLSWLVEDWTGPEKTKTPLIEQEIQIISMSSSMQFNDFVSIVITTKTMIIK